MKIKQFLTIGIVASASLGLPVFALALNVKDLPNPRYQGGLVADTANLLSPNTKVQLNQLLSKLELHSGDELAVVTVSQIDSDESPALFATELFNYSGIGKKGKNNGVLIFIDKGDRLVEMKTSYEASAILPDATLDKIITQQMTPRFQQGIFDGGTLAGTQKVVEVLESSSAPTPHSYTTAAIFKQKLMKDAAIKLSVIALIITVTALIITIGAVIKIVGDKIEEAHSRIRLSPTGSSYNVYEKDDTADCVHCDRPMRLLNSKTLYRLLSKPLQIAVQLKSVQVIGWHCPSCQPQIAGIKNIHLCIHDMDIKQFHFCPHCDERTVLHKSEVSVQPSQEREGRIDIHDTCQCCDYEYQAEEIIPLLRQSGNRSEVQHTDSFNYDYTTGLYAAGAEYLVAREVVDSSSSSSDSGSNWSDSSSGGTDFGGGISGGAGAGGSW